MIRYFISYNVIVLSPDWRSILTALNIIHTDIYCIVYDDNIFLFILYYLQVRKKAYHPLSVLNVMYIYIYIYIIAYNDTCISCPIMLLFCLL